MSLGNHTKAEKRFAGDGDDLRNLPLSMRKANLERLLRGRPDGIFVNPFETGAIGPDLFRAACDMGLEGLVSKRSDRPYRGGRSGSRGAEVPPPLRGAEHVIFYCLSRFCILDALSRLLQQPCMRELRNIKAALLTYVASVSPSEAFCF